MIPRDIPTWNGADLNRSAINAQNILNDLSRRKPSVIIFLLDCCRVYHSRNPDIDARNPNADDSKSVGLKVMRKAGSLVAFACAPGTIAIDGRGQRNGLFTKHLLKHITTSNKDIKMILRYVTRGVKKESDSRQIPFQNVALEERNIYLCFERTAKPFKSGKFDNQFNRSCP